MGVENEVMFKYGESLEWEKPKKEDFTTAMKIVDCQKKIRTGKWLVNSDIIIAIPCGIVAIVNGSLTMVLVGSINVLRASWNIYRGRKWRKEEKKLIARLKLEEKFNGV